MDEKTCCRCYCKIRIGQPFKPISSTSFEHLNYWDCIKELLLVVDARDAQVAQLQGQIKGLADSLRLTMKSIPEGITLAQYVENRIEGIFQDLAETIACAASDETPDQAAGIPMELFGAQETLLGAWRGYLAKIANESNPSKLEV